MSRAIRLLRTAPPARDPASAPTLILATVQAVRAGAVHAPFLLRRVEQQVSRAAAGTRRAARSLLVALRGAPHDAPALARGLVCYGGALEAEGQLADAGGVLALARTLRPECAEVLLHAARVARKRGLRGEANRLYQEVRTVAGDDAHLGRMARVGEALLAKDPLHALGRALRAAVRAGDTEAAAVAQEERAHARRAGGDRGGALRDYLGASARYQDPVDRARVLHAAADLLTAAGDPLGAREVLLLALDEGRPEQRVHARSRLHALSRALGDELGRRRWIGRHGTPLVSLTPSRLCATSRSRAAVVARWRRRTRSAEVPRAGRPG